MRPTHTESKSPGISNLSVTLRRQTASHGVCWATVGRSVTSLGRRSITAIWTVTIVDQHVMNQVPVITLWGRGGQRFRCANNDHKLLSAPASLLRNKRLAFLNQRSAINSYNTVPYFSIAAVVGFILHYAVAHSRPEAVQPIDLCPKVGGSDAQQLRLDRNPFGKRRFPAMDLRYGTHSPQVRSESSSTVSERLSKTYFYFFYRVLNWVYPRVYPYPTRTCGSVRVELRIHGYRGWV
jgi:hypothetical protein